MTSREQAAEIAIIVPSWNTRELLAACLDSIAATAGELRVETIVVDNGSSDGSEALVRDRFPSVRLLANPDNVGFARACNQGAALTQAAYVVFLNSDAQLLPGALQRLLALAAAKPRAGIIGAQIRNTDGSFQASHARFPSQMQAFLVLSGLGRLVVGPWYPSRGPADEGEPQRVDWVSGACVFARRAALVELGAFDEDYFMYSEELDLCYRMHRAGWEVWYEPAAHVIHLGGASSKGRQAQREAELYCSQVHFFHRHYGRWQAALLTAQICAFTAIKQLTHSLVRRVSGGRWGRPVVPLRVLVARLRAQ